MGRDESFGQFQSPSLVDRFGVWLSGRSIRNAVDTFEGAQIGDFGCGFQAGFTRTVLQKVASATLIDVAIAEDLVRHPKVIWINGQLPDVLSNIAEDSLDIILCLSVLEHLNDPKTAVEHFRRILRDPGICIINAPTWFGKRFLEFSAFRLGLSPVLEMDDHKRYYDPRDLWPLLIDAGFVPHEISCHRHKFGLNTIAICRTGVRA